VKQVIATRNEFGDFQRSFAEFSFNNWHANLPADVLLKEHAHVSHANVRTVERFFPPRRFYKRGAWAASLRELKSLETTRLKYDRIPSMAAAGASEPARRARRVAEGRLRHRARDASAQAQKADETGDGVEARRNAELKQTLATLQRESGEPQSVSGAVLSDFLAAQSEVFLEARAAFQAPAVAQSSEFTASDLRLPHEQRMDVLNQRGLCGNWKRPARRAADQIQGSPEVRAVPFYFGM
jgi:hypothetical protein